jgi:hypothetical protein
MTSHPNPELQVDTAAQYSEGSRSGEPPSSSRGEVLEVLEESDSDSEGRRTYG